MREKGMEKKVMIMQEIGEVDERVKGMRDGGDDYIKKKYDF